MKKALQNFRSVPCEVWKEPELLQTKIKKNFTNRMFFLILAHISSGPFQTSRGISFFFFWIGIWRSSRVDCVTFSEGQNFFLNYSIFSQRKFFFCVFSNNSAGKAFGIFLSFCLMTFINFKKKKRIFFSFQEFCEKKSNFPATPFIFGNLGLSVKWELIEFFFSLIEKNWFSYFECWELREF